jgi:hypothetical protein
MGLKDLFQRWTKGEDERAIERAREESEAHAGGYQRALDAEDFEGRKEDLNTHSQWSGSEAEAAAGDEDLPGGDPSLFNPPIR